MPTKIALQWRGNAWGFESGASAISPLGRARKYTRPHARFMPPMTRHVTRGFVAAAVQQTQQPCHASAPRVELLPASNADELGGMCIALRCAARLRPATPPYSRRRISAKGGKS